MDKNAGLYFHIPFCKNKCPYCDFYSTRACEYEYNDYVIALKEKLKYCNDVPFEFRGAAFEYTMQNVNKVAQLGWNNIPDLNISIGYNNANGFIPYGTSFEA